MKQFVAIAFAAAMMLGACEKEPPAPAAPLPTTGGSTSAGPAPNTVAYFNQVVGDRVFFATDQHTLDADARATLTRQAQWFMNNAGTNVTIEGHADERGTRQYNLALGARRANSVRRFLIAQGIPAARLRAVTFGKERPVALCSEPRCWSQNRRGVSIVAGAPTS